MLDKSSTPNLKSASDRDSYHWVADKDWQLIAIWVSTAVADLDQPKVKIAETARPIWRRFVP
jgi:hypothetical protein